MGRQNVISTISLGEDIFHPHGFGLLVSRRGNPCQLCHFLLKVFLRRDSWADIGVSPIVMCQLDDRSRLLFDGSSSRKFVPIILTGE